MLKKLKLLSVVALSLLIVNVCTFGYRPFAAEMNFAVQAVIPNNQIDKSQTYFDLKMKPGQKQTIHVDLRNDTKKPVTVSMKTNSAVTNDNGIVEYNNSTKKQDSSLKINFKDITKTPSEITLPAKSKKRVGIDIAMPTQGYDGALLGGIYFTEKVKDKENNKSKNGNQIVNRYAYTIGIKLTETDKEIAPHLLLKSVQATQVNYRNVVAANIQNDKAVIIKDLKIDGKIFKKGDSKELYASTKKNLRMAPNSNFNFNVDSGNKGFKPGTYIFRGVAVSHKNKWNFEKEFTISSKEASKLNENAVNIEKDYTWIYLLGGIIVVLLLLGIILFLVFKLKKQKKK